MRRVIFKARFLWFVAFAMVAGVWPIAAQAAVVPPSLNSAASFAVLSAAPKPGGAVTCTTNGTITGDVGSSGPSASVVHIPGCTITGAITAPVSDQVVTDFNTAYTDFRALTCDHTVTTLSGQNLLPGVWCVDAAATSTGSVLTLNDSSPGNWIFKIGATAGALTGTSFSVVMASGAAPPCSNVFWSVDAGVTMTDSHFVGTILAGAAITITRGTFNGNALATAGVTITGPGPATVVGCGAAAGTGGPGTTPQCLAAETALDIAKAKDVTEDAAERARDKKEGKDKDDEDKADRDKADRDSHESRDAANKEDKAENALMRSLERAVREACSSDQGDH